MSEYEKALRAIELHVPSEVLDHFTSVADEFIDEAEQRGYRQGFYDGQRTVTDAVNRAIAQGKEKKNVRCSVCGDKGYIRSITGQDTWHDDDCPSCGGAKETP